MATKNKKTDEDIIESSFLTTVEKARVNIISVGGTPYMSVPEFMRRDRVVIGGKGIFSYQVGTGKIVVEVTEPE